MSSVGFQRRIRIAVPNIILWSAAEVGGMLVVGSTTSVELASPTLEVSDTTEVEVILVEDSAELVTAPPKRLVSLVSV